ncbi:hypothetical protein BDZ89DRAFT_805437 [Hymenopellis radicata]|nr:hypothetical protein BDZ89DRAFT_805437 [Hymenopellis radicata]
MTPADTSTTSVSPLHGFQCCSEAFYDALWPHDSDVGLIEDSVGEPPALLQFIEALPADDGWLGNNPTEEDSMDVDSLDGSEGGDGQAQSGEKPSGVRFIDLKAHPALVFESALRHEVLRHRDRAAFIIRDEYRLFMKHAITCLRNQRSESAHTYYPLRFFVTGQPGIGKTFGAYYMLYYLLASRQSVLFIISPKSMYYFSANGVQYSSHKLPERDDKILEAIQQSWVLIDVNGGDHPNWQPPPVVGDARCVVWTSSPQEPAMRRFVDHFDAQKWFMLAWTNKEIAAATFVPSLL